MLSLNRSILLTSLVAVLSLQAHAAVVVNDSFDNYSNTAAMQANWGSSGVGTLDAGNGNPGNAASHPGGAVNSWIGSAFSLSPSSTEALVLTADIFDDGTSSNERITVGLRNGSNPLFEMGITTLQQSTTMCECSTCMATRVGFPYHLDWRQAD